MNFLDEGIAVVVANGLSSSPSVSRNIETCAEIPPAAVSDEWKRAIVANWGATGCYFSEVERVGGSGR